MKSSLRFAAIVLALAIVAAAASGQLAGWFAGSADARPASVVPAPPSASATTACLDEAELRRVIREELAAATTGSATAIAAQGAATPGLAERPPAPDASAAQVAMVHQQMDQYIQAGAISDSEMARLQSEIGRLDPAARRAAMQKLVRAMNSGVLDGRL